MQIERSLQILARSTQWCTTLLAYINAPHWFDFDIIQLGSVMVVPILVLVPILPFLKFLYILQMRLEYINLTGWTPFLSMLSNMRDQFKQQICDIFGVDITRVRAIRWVRVLAFVFVCVLGAFRTSVCNMCVCVRMRILTCVHTVQTYYAQKSALIYIQFHNLVQENLRIFNLCFFWLFSEFFFNFLSGFWVEVG